MWQVVSFFLLIIVCSLLLSVTILSFKSEFLISFCLMAQSSLLLWFVSDYLLVGRDRADLQFLIGEMTSLNYKLHTSENLNFEREQMIRRMRRFRPESKTTR